MDQWLTAGTEPPPSVYPRIADGTLVPWEGAASGWHPLPGVTYPTVIQQPELLDYGKAFEQHRRIDRHPPRRTGKHYGVRVPAVDADNNERGVVRLPRVAVPVATYTGWNLRNPAIGAETEFLSLAGSRIPFPRTAMARRELLPISRLWPLGRQYASGPQGNPRRPVQRTRCQTVRSHGDTPRPRAPRPEGQIP